LRPDDSRRPNCSPRAAPKPKSPTNSACPARAPTSGTPASRRAGSMDPPSPSAWRRSSPPRSQVAGLCPVLASPAASRFVAEDAYQALPFEHRVDQVTVQERDGVDVGQPWVRLDVEVGLFRQWRDGQDLVDLGQPSLGLGRQPRGRLSEFWALFDPIAAPAQRSSSSTTSSTSRPEPGNNSSQRPSSAWRFCRCQEDPPWFSSRAARHHRSTTSPSGP
jgi:hypothetical protein